MVHLSGRVLANGGGVCKALSSSPSTGGGIKIRNSEAPFDYFFKYLIAELSGCHIGHSSYRTIPSSQGCVDCDW